MIYYGRPKGKMERVGDAFVILCVILLLVVVVGGIIIHRGGAEALRNIIQPDSSPLNISGNR